MHRPNRTCIAATPRRWNSGVPPPLGHATDRDDTAKFWWLHSSHDPFLLGDWGEVDMGDGATLYELLAWANEFSPADRTLLALYDHGGGWRGACVDDTNNGWLEMDEIRQAISDAGSVDILAFTAPCLMGAIESAYELRDCVDMYIGSEELSGYAYWWDLMGPICYILDNSATFSNEQISTMIVGMISQNTAYIPDPEWLTMSAIKTSLLAPAIRHVDALSSHLASNIATLSGEIQQLRDRVWSFGMGGAYDIDEVDLYDLTEEYAAIAVDPWVVHMLEQLRETLDPAIVAECHGRSQPRAHGLSIYFPRRPDALAPDYGTVGLDFTADTAWDEFLSAYMNVYGSVTLDPRSDPRLELTCRPSLFDGSTRISFSLAGPEPVTLHVLDTTGRRVRTLCNRPLFAGRHHFVWDGCGPRGIRQPSGVYLCFLEVGGFVSTRRAHLIR